MLLADSHHCLCPIGQFVLKHQCCQRMQGTICIPKAPGGVVLEIGRTLYHAISTHVVASYIAPDLGSEENMIERSIENGAVAWRVELGTNTSQFLVPSVLCLGADGGEVLLVLFYLQIGQSTSLAYRRNGNLRLHYCTGVYLEYGLAIACINAVHDKFLDRAVKSQCIIHNVVGPATAGAITHQSEHVLRPDACLGNAVAYTAFQVKHHISITVALGEGELVNGGTVGSGHLCLNGPLVQKNTIIAWFHNLLLVCISGRNVVDKVLTRLCACITIDGHQGYVAQVAATCTAEVGVSKTDNAVA